MAESTWAPTPAAPSLATLQKWVAGYVGYPQSDEALETALAGIHMAVDRLNARTWNWTLVSDDIPFNSATIDYPLTANFKKPQRFMILNPTGGQVFRLPFISWQSFLNEYQNSETAGDPCVYSCANVKEYGTISLDVFPTTDWVSKYPSGRLFYYRKVQYDSQDGTPDWPSEFTPFVLGWAEGFVADRYAPAKAGPAYGRAEAALRELVRDDNDTQTDWE